MYRKVDTNFGKMKQIAVQIIKREKIVKCYGVYNYKLICSIASA